MVLRSVFIAILFAETALALYIAAFASFRRRERGAMEFALLMLGCAFYSGGYALEISRDTIAEILVVIKLEYLGIAATPAFWFLFAWRFTGRKPIAPLAMAALWVIPAGAVLLRWIDDPGGLYYAGLSLVPGAPFPLLSIERGPLYWVFFAYLQATISVGTAIILGFAFRASRRQRGQAIMAAIGSLAPWLGNACYLAGFVPWSLDPGPFTTGIAGALFAVALLRFRFLELMPFALERVVDAMADAVFVVDREGIVTETNASAAAIFGSAIQPSFAAPSGDSLLANLGDLARKGSGSLDFAWERGDGPPLRLNAQAFAVRNARGRQIGSVVIVRDTTETDDLMNRLVLLADTDSLTGTLIRRKLLSIAMALLEAARRSGRPFCVAIADLDHFKRVNDEYGHAGGDEALREAVARFKSALRKGDEIGRYGGDELGILLPGSTGAEGFRVMERMRERIAAEPIAFDIRAISITASVGVYGAVPRDGDTVEDFFNLADIALYEAKAAGRNATRLYMGNEGRNTPA
ncbi:MAG: diguanylate cyclase [Spirochaetes bacterium]|nr:diguanylate cyclase [Spirochaetota bacterium]